MYSSKYLWRIGNLCILLVVLGVPAVVIALLKIIELYDLQIPFKNDDDVFIDVFIIIILIAALWIKVSFKWLAWARANVKEEDEFDLEGRIEDKKESFVIKPWNELSKTTKLARFVGVVVLLGACLYGDYYRSERNRNLANEGRETQVTILKVRKKYTKKKLNVVATYHYTVDSIFYEDEQILNGDLFTTVEEKNGFPILSGSQYVLRYWQKDPTVHRIEFHKPLGQTRETQKQIVFASLAAEIPDSTQRSCYVNTICDSLGFAALAQVYHRNTSYWENEKFNKIKYGQLARKSSFKQTLKNCD